MSFLSNFLIISLWHYFILILVTQPEYKFYYRECVQTDIRFFIKKEKKKKKVLMIKKWKDLIPQYVSKSGFSKKKMLSLKIDYIKKFIAETYRAELDHLFCCFVIPIIFFLNTAKLSIILSTIVIICNLPCIIIQRYNRLRLRHLMLKMNNKKKLSNYNFSEN